MRATITRALILSFATLSPAYAETRNYDWLTVGEKSGELLMEDDGDGVLSYRFSFNDRGRGPEIEAVYQMGSDDIPTAITITGKNYTKGDARETFAVEDGVARWKSGTSEGERKLLEPALYMPGGIQAPAHTAILARALLKDPDKRMATLPGGALRIEEVETAIFAGEVSATLYALYGNSPYPGYIWLDKDKNLFGADYGWFAVAPAGMAAAMPKMKARQDAATDAVTAQLSGRFRHHASGLVVIQGARLFDSLTGKTHANSTVFVQDGVISAVYHEAVDAPEGANLIDGKGKFLMPALWDMHAHISTDYIFNYLSAGVLNIRDMANDPEYIIRLRSNVAAEKIAGPDIWPMGFIDKRSPFAAPTGMLADNLEQALSHVDWYAQRGFMGIKLYSSIEPAWVAPIAEAAHRRGMTLLGHIPSGMVAEEAIRAGYDEITHLNMLFLNFAQNGKLIDTRTPQRFIEPIRFGGTLDPDGPEMNALVDLMIDKGVAHEPTFTVFQDMFLNQPGKTAIIAQRFISHLPQAERNGLISSESFNKGLEAEGVATAEVAKAIVRKLHERGIRILPGTDTSYPGFVLLRELESLADAGIAKSDVLQLATIESARHLGLDQSLGSITPGKKAQLILVEGDPTDNIADLYKVRTVMKGTSLFLPEEIHGVFGIEPFE